MCLASTIFVSRVSRMAVEIGGHHEFGCICNAWLLQDCLSCLRAGRFEWGTLHCGCNHHPLYQVPPTIPNNPQLSQIARNYPKWLKQAPSELTDMKKVSFQSYTLKKKVFSLAVFFWTNVMAWDIYKTFGQRTILSHIRPTGKDHLKSNHHLETSKKTFRGSEKAVFIL